MVRVADELACTEFKLARLELKANYLQRPPLSLVMLTRAEKKNEKKKPQAVYSNNLLTVIFHPV